MRVMNSLTCTWWASFAESAMASADERRHPSCRRSMPFSAAMM
jgi:hypothetical protein